MADAACLLLAEELVLWAVFAAGYQTSAGSGEKRLCPGNLSGMNVEGWSRGRKTECWRHGCRHQAYMDVFTASLRSFGLQGCIEWTSQRIPGKKPKKGSAWRSLVIVASGIRPCWLLRLELTGWQSGQWCRRCRPPGLPVTDRSPACACLAAWGP